MLERKLAELIQQMIEERLIESNEKEKYMYVYTCIVEKILTVGSILILSIIRNNLIPAIFFLIFFFTLRKRTGGYHADTFIQCYFGTIIIYFMVSELSYFLQNHVLYVMIITLVALFIIEFIGTINHPNIKMNQDELMQSKKAARINGIVEECIIIFLVLIKVNSVFVLHLAFAVILCATLMCIAKLIKQEEKEDEKEKQTNFESS